MSALVPLLVGLPLAGAGACAALHARVLARRRREPDAAPNEAVVGAIATLAVAAAFGIAAILLARLLGAPPEARRLEADLGTWIESGRLVVRARLVLDPLASVLACVVTGVGALIHLYSIAYMRRDPGFARYFACLNLFVAAMMLLVLGGDLPLSFVGWEGVGLCSYLLIGFWHAKGAAADAGRKAFVVNRIGDAGFLLGIFLLHDAIGRVDFEGVNAAARSGALGAGTAAAAAALLFCGAIGKSAQIPLQVWLPDAMAGPTPVSALIHAATMVTAGVYLVARLAPLYLAAPAVLAVVGAVGGATALLAACAALAQRDLKKALAWSTISQLGLMFLGEGSGAFDASIAHLVTHAFFKALLFLAAGSVIHALEGEQDLAKMGGLASRIPATFLCFVVGAAALAGLPPFAGFFSKDEILGGALHGPHPVLFGTLGFATSLLTAIYAFRLVLAVFSGRPRHSIHPHESPPTMLHPMRVLALLSLAGGMLAWIPFVDARPLAAFLAPSLGTERGEAAGGAHVAVVFLSFAVAVVGTLVARRVWRGRGLEPEERLARSRGWRLAAAGGGFDDFYRRVVGRGARLFSIVCDLVDHFLVDGAVNGTGRALAGAGGALRVLQNGKFQVYAIGIAVGTAALLFASFFLGRSG